MYNSNERSCGWDWKLVKKLHKLDSEIKHMFFVEYNE